MVVLSGAIYSRPTLLTNSLFFSYIGELFESPLKSTSYDKAINTAKEFDNTRVVEELQHYCTFSEAIDEYPFLDDIIVGVCNLDLGGNSRPLSTRVVYTLLSTQSVISTKLIMDAHACSRPHAQKICACLRIASREVVKHLERFPNKYVYNGGMWPQKVIV